MPSPRSPFLAVLVVVAACSGDPQVAQTQTPDTASPTVEPALTPTPVPTTTTPTPTAAATAQDEPTAEPTRQGPVDLGVTEVATDLEVPWAVAFAPDGRAFITERDTGRVRVLDDGSIREIHRFDVDASGEGGLLGLALSPDFAADGWLYAYFSTSSDNRIVRFRPGEDAEVLVEGIPHASIHDGGRIAFGPDGMLYAGTGDAAQSGLAQDQGSLAGKILRLRPDGGVPDDNPTTDSYVWSLGHRNVQGLAWDADGRMYATEFGPDRDDEINRIRAGNNYGWPLVTGNAGDERFTDPVVVAQPPEASWSGAALLSGGAIPQWEGDLLVASLRGNRLWRVDLEDGRVRGTDQRFAGEFGRLRLAVQAPDGSLWVATSNRDGRGSPGPDDDRILRIGPPR